MKQRTSQLLFQYWNDVRGQRLAPERFDIEPSRIAAILPETCILERDDANVCSFRLAGTRVCDNWGQELRGTGLHELMLPADRPVLDEMLATITAQGAVGLLELSGLTKDGREVMFEVIILPLLHTSGAVTRYLAGISPFEAPYWLGVERLAAGPLAEHALVWPDGRPHALIERTLRQAPFLPAMTNSRIVRVDRRQFRVFEGGRGTESDVKVMK